MTIAGFFFYLFSVVLVASGSLVITARSPVHSVLFLILAFFNAAGLFVLLGAEFLAMILVIVYVGAVAVLFLFVVMMLDVDFAELRKGSPRYVPLGLLDRRDPAVRAARWSSASFIVAPGAIQPSRRNRSRTPRPSAPFSIRNTSILRAFGRRSPGRDDRGHRAHAPSQAHRQAAGCGGSGRPPARGCDRSGPCGNWEGDFLTAMLNSFSISPIKAATGISLQHYLGVAAILFTLGVFGIFLNRKNVIIILMSIELMLLAVNINLVAMSAYLNDITGQIYALIVLTVAAAEAAIGLAIVVIYFRNRGSIAVDDINSMRG